MTSSEAQAYAVIALNELIKSEELKLDDGKVELLKRFSREMFAAIYSIEGQEAEKEADRLLGSVVSMSS